MHDFLGEAVARDLSQFDLAVLVLVVLREHLLERLRRSASAFVVNTASPAMRGSAAGPTVTPLTHHMRSPVLA